MLKLIIGVKGTGKTKVLIDMVNSAMDATKCDVVCIDKGAQLRFDIKPAVRLVNSEEYLINDASTLYGFIAGMLASNHDVTDLFVDGTLRICNRDLAAFEELLVKLDSLLEKVDVNVTMTVSMPAEEITDTVRKYI